MNPTVRFSSLVGSVLLSAALAAPAPADAPSPLDSGVFGFPGQTSAPGSARSAALGRSDRWLGEEPFDNPAVFTTSRISITPALQRVSRQDLRAGNRNYNETSAFVDFAGAWAGFSAGEIGLAVYAHQPVIRLESFAFERGTSAAIPGAVKGDNTQREYRAGVAVSAPVGALRVGLGAELTGRSDTYELQEISGSPESGMRELEFSGTAVGGQGGVRWESEAPWGGPLRVGVAGRWVPAMSVDATQTLTLLVGDSTSRFTAERDAGWDAGFSASIPAGETFRVLASFGGRSEREWTGLDLTEGSGTEWRLGGEFHDERDPWTFRFGVGQEFQSDVPEERAGIVGLGFNWDFEGLLLDVGVMRRTLQRDGSPTSYDDRLLASAIVTF